MDASHVYVRVLALGCFYSHIYKYPNLSESADRVAGQLRGDKEYPFSGVTKSGRVWRRVPESDARSVPLADTSGRGPVFNVLTGGSVGRVGARRWPMPAGNRTGSI